MVLVALVLVPDASAARFVKSSVLAPAASFVAGKPVTVYCATSLAGWNRFVAAATDTTDVIGLAMPGTSTMRLSPLVCQVLGLFGNGGKTPPTAEEGLADAIETVTHEAIHLRGESDEGITDCDAMHEMPRVAVRFFHVASGIRLRTLMAAAWVYHRSKSAPYKTVC